jgi:hypothetical protein
VPSSSRIAPLWLTVLLSAVGVVAIVIGIVYFAESAGHLPSFFPGHLAGSAHKHTKHGVAALILGVAALAGAWISSGRKRSPA